MDIYPTILTQTTDELEKQLARDQYLFNVVQIDIADGRLVENTTLSLSDALSVCVRHKELQYDFHLMVSDAADHLDQLDQAVEVNVRYAFIHTAAGFAPSLLSDSTHKYGVCLSINPDENIATISKRYEIQLSPAIQIMTVIPGAQGRPFEYNALKSIEQLRKMDYRGKIFIDGAVNDTTISTLANNEPPPDVVGPGSYFSNATDEKDLRARYEALLTNIKNGYNR